MTNAARRTISLAPVGVLLAGAVAAIVVAVRLGGMAGFSVPASHLGPWLRAAPTEVLVAGAARVATVVLASWLLLATALSLVRRVVPPARAWGGLDLATPPSVRHLLDRALAVGLGASLTIGAVHPAGAATPSTSRRGSLPVAVTVDEPVPRVPPVSAPAARRAPAPTAGPARPPPRAERVPTTVVVRPGDNLWLIARRAAGSDRPDEIAPYWRAVIAANLATLRSHDPNLIFPGERLVLPPVGATG